MKLKSRIAGEWVEGSDKGVEVNDAVNGEPVCNVSSTGIDFAGALTYGRQQGGRALRQMTLHDRANRLKALAAYLMEKKEGFYALSSRTGATRADSWVDIEGGIGTLFSYSSIARRELANETFIVEGNLERLSKTGSFLGHHLLVPKEGVAVHIDAFNFPCWGMLEKIAPSLIAGVPVIVKPATVTAYLTQAMVAEIIASDILPEGSIQLICGGVGDLFDHLEEQDVVTFTGSASTGRQLKIHPNIIQRSVPFNMEADSLNCSILGAQVEPGSAEFDLYIKGVCDEMTVKAGQKCTAIRRALIPEHLSDAVAEAIKARLDATPVGDPVLDEVRMGPLVGLDQRKDVWAATDTLMGSTEVICGGSKQFEVIGADPEKGAFFPATLLYCKDPQNAEAPHSVEAFGPVCTLMPYHNTDDAIELAKRGRGSLTGSIVTADDEEASRLVLGTAAYHGRMLVLNERCAKESTGHGSPLAQLVHGGPGRAGGGEELGGTRAIKHYMQRTALQGSPDTLMALTRQYITGATQTQGLKHPFRKDFDELAIGDTLITHRRTITEADIVNFGCLSGDHFYAHFDETAAADSVFGKRVAHGYLIISVAAGMFVDPSPGPVLANYGLESLRFVEPVGIGDTIQARLTAKQKIDKGKAPGVVEWDVEVTNQHAKPVALYSILTLVERKTDGA